jgi:hypothetical protein
VVNLLWSALWLRRFQFGPAEWLWRSLTYWKIQPLLAPAPAERSVDEVNPSLGRLVRSRKEKTRVALQLYPEIATVCFQSLPGNPPNAISTCRSCVFSIWPHVIPQQ